MKIIDGTFTYNLSVDTEVDKEQFEYVNSILTEFDLTKKSEHKKIIEKFICLPIDKQICVVYVMLDRFYSLSIKYKVAEILNKQYEDKSETLDEYKNRMKNITKDKYPTLFKEAKIKNHIFEKCLSSTEFTKYRDVLINLSDDSSNQNVIKYENEFNIKIEIL